MPMSVGQVGHDARPDETKRCDKEERAMAKQAVMWFKTAKTEARRSFGAGWNLIGEDLRRRAVALELVSIFASQDIADGENMRGAAMLLMQWEEPKKNTHRLRQVTPQARRLGHSAFLVDYHKGQKRRSET
jgi:hypothetical protein